MQALTEKTKSFTGVWHNQHGSEIDLVVLEDGHVRGTFILRAPDGTLHEEYPIVGFAGAELIAFCANFGRHDSMTAWVGQMPEGAGCFEATWQMAVNAHKDPSKRWRATMTGSDTFVRGKCPQEFEASHRCGSHPSYCSII